MDSMTTALTSYYDTVPYDSHPFPQSAVEHLEALRARFDAVVASSARIERNDAAYGPLCGWISGRLEECHVRQDELIAYVEENVELAADELGSIAWMMDGS